MKLQEIAKSVRSDIRAAVKAGELPEGTKVSVVCDFYSMGCALRVKITDVPGWMTIVNEAWVRWREERPSDWHCIAGPEGSRERYTAAASELLAKVDAIVSKYHEHERYAPPNDDIVRENFSKCVDFDRDDYERVRAVVRRKLEQSDRRHTVRAECVPA